MPKGRNAKKYPLTPYPAMAERVGSIFMNVLHTVTGKSIPLKENTAPIMITVI